MSQRNVDLVRSIIDRWSAGEVPWDLYDPAIEWYPAGEGPDSRRSFSGHDGVTQALEDLAEVWTNWRFTPRRFVDRGDEVVAVVRTQLRGRTSGVDVDEDWGYLFKVKGGKAIRVELFTDPQAAIEAAR